MIVLSLERVSPSVRGELTRWLSEVRPSVFVGRVPAVVRDRLWDMVVGKLGDGAGALIYTSNTEQGFTVRTYGEVGREPVDFDGLVLMRRPGKAVRR